MKDNLPTPGVSRKARISAQGLDRLEKQLASGMNISTAVLAQWIRRYGDPARRIIKKYNQYRAELNRVR